LRAARTTSRLLATHPTKPHARANHLVPFLRSHGPFNSWGRVPYLLPWLNGTAGVGIKRTVDEISLNFIVAGGGANGGALDQ